MLFQVTSTNKTFKMYEACRIGEIQATCERDMQDWYWVPTELNIADINTRGKCPEELGPGSAWQQGPEFLSDPFEEWPIKSEDDLRRQSEESASFQVSLQVEDSSAVKTGWFQFYEECASFQLSLHKVDYGFLRFDRTRWEIMIRGLALVVACIRNKRFRRVTHTAHGLREAELIIIKQVQIGLLPDLDPANPGIASKSKYRRLGPVLTSDLIWGVGGRSRGATSYPVLIPTCVAPNEAATGLRLREHSPEQYAPGGRFDESGYNYIFGCQRKLQYLMGWETVGMFGVFPIQTPVTNNDRVVYMGGTRVFLEDLSYIVPILPLPI